MWLPADILVGLGVVGLAAGAVTTVSGVGGALLAVAATSAIVTTREALAITAIGLLVGSVHRLWLYRQAVEPAVIARLGPAVVAGAIVGSQVAGAIPERVARAAVIAVTAIAIAVSIRSAARSDRMRSTSRLPVSAAGLLIGLVGAAAGGAALLAGPVIQALGLRGARYLATTTAIAALFNLARGAGYLAAGMYASTSIASIVVLSAGCVAGNLAGLALRDALGERASGVVEIAAPVVALALAAVGAR